MRNLIIKKADKTIVSAADLYNLRRVSFEQWEEQGLDMSEAYISLEQFRHFLSDRAVFVALDAETGELLCMHTLKLTQKKGFAGGSNLAVSPATKREGIASRLLEEEAAWLRREGYRYLIGDTPIPATWSVCWHLKNGYRIVGYLHGQDKDYASYLFRKQIYYDLRHHPFDLLWMRPLAPMTARLCLVATYIFTRLCKSKTGRLNRLGRFVKSRMHK